MGPTHLKSRITQDAYDKKHKEFRTKQEEIKQRMDKLQQADEDYYITASYILSLANRAYDLFLSSEPMIKRQLLKFLLQNCEIENGNLRYTLNYPFSAIFSYTKSQSWLSLQENYRTILPYFKKLSQHYNNIPEFMKVGASA